MNRSAQPGSHARTPQVRVVDERGIPARLVRKLGRGGQGSVYQTDLPSIAAKIIGPLGGDATQGIASKNLKSRIEEVTTLPLRGIKVAHPESVLRQVVSEDDPAFSSGFVYTGYFMRLLQGMVPIRKLFPRAEDTSRQKLSHVISSGGLRRRFRVLARLAGEIAKLHSRSLVYVDLSPDNVFISEDKQNDEAWLIDCDNIHLEGTAVSGVITPGYGAPELCCGDSAPSVESDLFSLAVLVHEVLRWTMPFNGALTVSDGWDSDDGGEETFRRAERGELPWVDDPGDATNRCDWSLPLDICAPSGSKLRACFQRALCSGRRDPASRPAAAEWCRALWQMADLCLTCNNCGGTVLAIRDQCSFCDAILPHHVRVHVDWRDNSRRYLDWDERTGSSPDTEEPEAPAQAWTLPVWDAVIPLDSGPNPEVDEQVETVLPVRWLDPFSVSDADDVALRVLLEPRRPWLTIFPLQERRIWSALPNGGEVAAAVNRIRIMRPENGVFKNVLLVGQVGARVDYTTALARVSFAIAGGQKK